MSKASRAAICALVLGVTGAATAQETAPPPEAVTAPAPTGTVLADTNDRAPGSGVYGGAEYLLWWLKSTNVPPIATRGNAADLIPGAIGQPGTQILLGNQGFGNNDPFQGGRFTLGYWFDDERTWGLETNFLFLGEQRTTFNAAAGTPGTGVLALPVNVVGGPFTGEASIGVGVAGAAAGTINYSLMQRLWGTEANVRRTITRSDLGSTSLLAGVRYLDLEESLDLTATTSFPLPPAPPLFTTIGFESHATRNQFYGGQIGAQSEAYVGRFIVSGIAKIALGNVHEEVTRIGAVRVTPGFAPPITFPGGPAYVGTDNALTRSRDRFAVVPELGVNLGYKVRDNVTANVGYTFLYLSDAARPGENIDRTLNGLGNPRPLLFRDSDFWAQGVNIGLTIRY